jgi:C-terminal processing protease CtpA/Prc
VVVCVWLPVWAAGARAQGGRPLSTTERAISVTMLRQVEEDVRTHYYDPAFHGIDLSARVRLAEERLQANIGFNDAIAVISDLLAGLDDLHTTFLPPNRRARVDYGWQMAMVGGLPLVVSVDPGTDAAAQGLAPGDRVLLLNGVEPSRATLPRLTYVYRFIRPELQQRVAVLKPDGTAHTLDIRSRVQNRAISELRALLLELEEDLDRARDHSEAVGKDILVWKMAVFGNPDHVNAMIGNARDYKALILDLRGNGGGAIAALRELVSRCFDHEVHVATVQQRHKRERHVAKAKRNGFRGQLIVLVDSRSASAAEVFARIVQLEKRGRVIGDRTAGAVMTARIMPHQVGVVGFFYATSVTIGDVRMSDGASLEKTGVEPDEIVLPTPADLAAGRDPALAEAIAIAGGAITAAEAGRLFK